MTDIERLIAIEEIKQLKARYCRFCDTKDWAAFTDLFAEDAVFDVTSGTSVGAPTVKDSFTTEGLKTGKANIGAWVSTSTKLWSFHHCHTPEIEILAPDRARAVWAMEDRLNYADTAPIRSVHGYGHYHETYVKQDDGWRISTLKVTRLGVSVDRNDAA